MEPKTPPPPLEQPGETNNTEETLSSSTPSTLAAEICNKIAAVFTNPTTTTTPSPLTVLVNEIASTTTQGRRGSIFVYGVGREGLMMKALCMRLSHLGLKSHCVFDMTTPPVGPNDLLVASAGPGGFSTVDAICGVAKRNGARVVVLTARPESEWLCVKEYASVVVHVPAQTMADDDHKEGEEGGGSGGSVVVVEGKGKREVLPMGSLYEGALFVLFEMVVFKLGEVIGESPEVVRSRHTNLE